MLQISSHHKKTINFRLLGLVSVCFGSLLGLGSLGLWFNQANPSLFCEKNKEIEVLVATSAARLKVDIGGAVKRPGIYEVELGDRVADVVRLAGGFSYQADKYYLNSKLNLAKRVSDGEKIYVPFKGETQWLAAGSWSLSSEESLDEDQVYSASRISLNLASKAELESLTGVGEVRAQKIIDGRPYNKIDDVVTKKILPKSVFEANRDSLAL